MGGNLIQVGKCPGIDCAADGRYKTGRICHRPAGIRHIGKHDGRIEARGGGSVNYVIGIGNTGSCLEATGHPVGRSCRGLSSHVDVPWNSYGGQDTDTMTIINSIMVKPFWFLVMLSPPLA